MKCPKCRLINDDDAPRCDCGYRFDGARPVAVALREPAGGSSLLRAIPAVHVENVPLEPVASGFDPSAELQRLDALLRLGIPAAATELLHIATAISPSTIAGNRELASLIVRGAGHAREAGLLEGHALSDAEQVALQGCAERYATGASVDEWLGTIKDLQAIWPLGLHATPALVETLDEWQLRAQSAALQTPRASDASGQPYAKEVLRALREFRAKGFAAPGRPADKEDVPPFYCEKCQAAYDIASRSGFLKQYCARGHVLTRIAGRQRIFWAVGAITFGVFVYCAVGPQYPLWAIGLGALLDVVLAWRRADNRVRHGAPFPVVYDDLGRLIGSALAAILAFGLFAVSSWAGVGLV